MVFSGHPSRACRPCRDKRRKCDYKTPQCSQCIRARCFCFGYRDTNAFRFKDETKTVTRNAQQIKVGGDRSSSHASWPSEDDHELLETLPEEAFGRPLSINVSPDDVALAYYISVFSSSGPISYLTVHIPTLVGDKDVLEALHATAFASMSLAHHSHELMQAARSHYLQALARTNRDLCDPQSATRDETLACVLLLTAYEALAFHGRHSPSDWILHAQGLLHLLRLRGKEQLDSDLGRRLLHLATVNILTGCVARRLPVPSGLIELQQYTARFDSASHFPDGHFLKTCMDYITMNRDFPTMEDGSAVEEALRLVEEATWLLHRFHETEPYTSSPAAGSVGPWCAATENISCNGPVMLQYRSQHAVRFSNTLRLLHVVANDWVFCALDRNVHLMSGSELPPSFQSVDKEELMAQATMQANQTIYDMLATIPYSLNSLQSQSGKAARSLIYPLTCVASTRVCPETTRLYIIDCLREIARRHTLDQADHAATMLEERASLEDWVHLLHMA